LLEERHEFGLHNQVSKLFVEGSNIRYESRGEQDISNNFNEIVFQHGNGISPTGAFRSKSSNETVSHIKFRSTLSSFSLSRCFVIHDFLELVLQDFKGSIQLSDFSFHSSFFGVSSFKIDSGLFSLGLFRSHIGEYIVENSNVLNPITKTSSSVRFTSNNFRSKLRVIKGTLDLCEVNSRDFLGLNISFVIFELVNEFLRFFELRFESGVRILRVKFTIFENWNHRVNSAQEVHNTSTCLLNSSGRRVQGLQILEIFDLKSI